MRRRRRRRRIDVSQRSWGGMEIGGRWRVRGREEMMVVVVVVEGEE